MALSHYSLWYDNITVCFFFFQPYPESIMFLFLASALSLPGASKTVVSVYFMKLILVFFPGL